MRLPFRYVQHTATINEASELKLATFFVLSVTFGHLHCWEMQDGAHFIDYVTEFSSSYFT